LFKNKDWLDAYTSQRAALLADRPSFPENPISPRKSRFAFRTIRRAMTKKPIRTSTRKTFHKWRF
jgi:hypothetical protein